MNPPSQGDKMEDTWTTKDSDEVVLYFKACDSVFIFWIRWVVLGIVNWFKVVSFFLVEQSSVLGYFVTWR